ncbi:hypothetical protein [Sediminicola sp. 1XM1-17]|uniref:hypothetical protein n=1 Tax=Sediminicola sp. 1XM1-17 TaxID=3127702 RepID=UPI00307873D2
MKKTTTLLWIALVVVILGFGVGIYLQDLKHQESTEAAWKANRFNMERYYKIRQFTGKINAGNWEHMRDSIGSQLDSFMILRYRKEMDSLNKSRSK